MILDLQTMFSGSVDSAGTKTGQAITATAISDNVLDVRNFLSGVTTPATADEGLDTELYLVVQAKTAAAGGDAAKTLTITLESDTAAALNAAAVVHFASAAILGSAITAGAVLVRTKLPSDSYKRYVGMRYTVSAGFTSFQILAYLTPNVDRNISYPAGFTIDV